MCFSLNCLVEVSASVGGDSIMYHFTTVCNSKCKTLHSWISVSRHVYTTSRHVKWFWVLVGLVVTVLVQVYTSSNVVWILP